LTSKYSHFNLEILILLIYLSSKKRENGFLCAKALVNTVSGYKN